MPIKLSDEVRTQFETNLSIIEGFNAKDLIRRDDLGADLNFADAEADFETAINLFKGLIGVDIMRVPESKIQNLNKEMSAFIDSIDRIKKFSALQGSTERQNLIQNIIYNYTNSWFDTISPIVAYCTKAGKSIWFYGIIGISIAIMIYSSVTFWWCPIVLEEPYLYRFAQAILPRFTGLIVLFYILVICSKNYRAQSHNYIINKNKQNALSTFETFVKATSNEEIRNAVLLQTTKAIFSNPKSGYLKEDGSDDEPTQIIEIVKDMSKVIKS